MIKGFNLGIYILAFIALNRCSFNQKKMNNLIKVELNDWRISRTGSKEIINENIFLALTHPNKKERKLIHITPDHDNIKISDILTSDIVTFTKSSEGIYIESGIPGTSNENFYLYNITEGKLQELKQRAFYVDNNIFAVHNNGKIDISVQTSKFSINNISEKMGDRANLGSITDTTIEFYSVYKDTLIEVIIDRATKEVKSTEYPLPSTLTIKSIKRFSNYLFLTSYQHQVYRFNLINKSFSETTIPKPDISKGFTYSEVCGRYFSLVESQGGITTVKAYDLKTESSKLEEIVRDAKLVKDSERVKILIIDSKGNSIEEWDLEDQTYQRYSISEDDKISSIHLVSHSLFVLGTENGGLGILHK